MGEDYARLSELHEVATERTAQLAAVIEKAKAWMSDNARMQTELDLILGSADAAAVLREVRADAWDEGYGSDDDVHTPRVNPYREES